MDDWELLVDGIDFAEGPRWHDGRLWYSDFHQRTISSVDADGDRRTEYGELPDRPSGLGWLPSGELLVVFMTQRRVMRDPGDRTLVLHADLSDLAPWHCNDMVVSERGMAYVGNFGFDLDARASFRTTTLVLVRPDGSAEVVADDMRFPNGSVITPDGGTLIVGQSFGGNFLAFDIADDGSLSGRREWAAIEGTAPDGCTLDAVGGIWFADAVGSQVVRVEQGGTVTDRIPTPQPTFACMLGGDDGRTLYALCAPGSDPAVSAGRAAGAIHHRRVAHPHAGLP
jgi:sugar lactone lactonase YvrE